MTDIAIAALAGVAVAAVTAVPTTIGAIVGGLALFKTNAIGKQITAAAGKQEEIHELVNNNLDTVRTELAALKISSATEIHELRRTVASLSRRPRSYPQPYLRRRPAVRRAVRKKSRPRN